MGIIEIPLKLELAYYVLIGLILFVAICFLARRNR
jgi:hypothetical protein